jgi:hypothetical protein
MDLAAFELADGGSVLVEVEPGPGVTPVGRTGDVIKFGVKLDAEVGAVIAKTGVEGHFEVKLTWRAPTATPANGS